MRDIERANRPGSTFLRSTVMIPIPMSGKTLSQACFPAQPFCIYFAISEISDTFALPTRRNILRVPLSALIRQPLRPDHPVHAKPSSPPHRQRKAHTSPDGGIGRRAGLKHQWSNPCRFDPGSGYLLNRKSLKVKDLRFFLLVFALGLLLLEKFRMSANAYKLHDICVLINPD